MEIRLTLLEAILLVIASLFGGITLSATLNGNLESGFIYFSLIMFAIAILIMKKRTSKKN
ncbi:MAG: hypothetical protein WBL27_09015 [Salinimicrobium sp.]